MSQPIRYLISWVICSSLILSGTSSLRAQTASGQTLNTAASQPDYQPHNRPRNTPALPFDINAPLINHTPSDMPRLAGEPQSVVAEIVDNQSVRSASLFVKTSTTPVFAPASMTVKSNGTTWQATIQTTADDSYVWYYLIAEDAEGNRVQKGSQRNPLMMQLQQSKYFTTSNTSNASDTNPGRKRWIAVGLGALAIGALIASTSSDDPQPSCCEVTIDLTNVGE